MATLKLHKKINSTSLQIEELEDWIGKDVEISIVEKKTAENNISSNVAGRLSGYHKTGLKDNEDNIWENVVAEKHGNYRR